MERLGYSPDGERHPNQQRCGKQKPGDEIISSPGLVCLTT